MKLILIIVLTMLNPETKELNIQYKPVDDVNKCVAIADAINKELVAKSVQNAYASCVITNIGENV